MWSSSIVLLLAGYVCLVNANSATVTVADTWDGRYHLKLTIDATSDLRGWEVILRFSSSITTMDVSRIFSI